MREINKYTHELRAPINSLKVILSLMEKDIDDSFSLKNYINESKMICNYLLMLVQEILEIDKLSKGELQINEIEFDILLYLEDLIPIFNQYITFMKKKFSYNLDKIKHHKLIGDKTRFIQIILNFLSNAEKYSNHDDLITFEVIKEELLDDDMVEFTFLISDTGMGMSKEFIEEKYFKPYEQEKENEIGSGLGGYITCYLIKLLNGKVDIVSNINEGTKIFLTLPFKIKKEKNKKTNDNKILFVDDDIFMRDLIDAVLSEKKIDVDFASDGKEALDKINNGNYDLVFIDIEMPNMNGIECIKNRKENKKEKWIAMSAHNNFEYQKYGFDDFMIKPFLIEELIEKIK